MHLDRRSGQIRPHVPCHTLCSACRPPPNPIKNFIGTFFSERYLQFASSRNSAAANAPSSPLPRFPFFSSDDRPRLRVRLLLRETRVEVDPVPLFFDFLRDPESRNPPGPLVRPPPPLDWICRLRRRRRLRRRTSRGLASCI